MNVEEVFEQWSNIEEESDECVCSSESEDQDMDYESDDKQSWGEDTGKFLCIFLAAFTSLLQIRKNSI